jgi:hypothetical protein
MTEAVAEVIHRLKQLAGDAPAPRPKYKIRFKQSALDSLCQRLNLSSFERQLLVLAAALELDGSVPELCQRISSGAVGGPTFGIGLSAFGKAHWSALAPGEPLRRWRLLEITKGAALVHSPLRIDEAILGYLLGRVENDAQLLPYLDCLPPTGSLTPGQQELAGRLSRVLTASEAPVLQLVALDDSPTAMAVAAAVCEIRGQETIALSAATLPSAADELELLILLCERHVRLHQSAIVIHCGDLAPTDGREPAISRLIDRLSAPVLLIGRERRHGGRRPILTFEIGKPSHPEQICEWLNVMGPGVVPLPLAQKLASQFHLDRSTILAVCADARAQMVDADSLEGHLWDAVRQQSRPKLEALAQRVESNAGWDDLILANSQMSALKAIAAQISLRTTVHDDWEFSSGSERGLGLAVLFAGSSGTGKTTAAEVLARELRLDLYRVDLSQVVSKYIGETEKNLRRVFDAADEGGVVLLFDEADALFGKRTEVTSSNDRHANVEVGYLLQRIEAFRGLAILTTNMKTSIDAAFQRRLRFIVTFPFPDATIRAQIWARMFPAKMPAEVLDYDRLAQLALSGGQIRSVALNAAFLAAAAGQPLSMSDIKAAARMEYGKQDKTLSEAELKGWPE